MAFGASLLMVEDQCAQKQMIMRRQRLASQRCRMPCIICMLQTKIILQLIHDIYENPAALANVLVALLQM